MKTLKLKLGVAIIVIFLCGVVFVIFSSKNTNTGTDNQTSAPLESINPSSSPTSSSSEKTYSIAQVASHKNAKSCWTTIRGNVYDLTPWIDQHPGGAQAILSLCGNDGTSAFISIHGGQAEPEAELKTFLIGKLQ